MTAPIRWPNNAAEARDRAAEDANSVIILLEPLVEKGMHDQEELRRVSLALSRCQSITRRLEKVGAQTMPG